MEGPYRHARLYLTGAALSYIGTAIVPVALSFAVLDCGLGADALGLVLAAQSIPTILLLLVGGIAGDRLSRRAIMIAADFLRAAIQALLAACLVTGHVSLFSFMAAAALIGLGNAFFQPASGGFVTEIVAREQLARTNGVLRTANALAMVVGPAIGALVVIGAGPGWGIALDAATYAASAACLLAIRLPTSSPRGRFERQPIGKDLADALRSIRDTRWLMLVVGQFAVLNMLAIAPFKVIAPAIFSHISGGAGMWGSLLTAIGVGAVAGSVACIRWQPRKTLLGVEFASLLLVAPILALAAHAPLPLILAGGVLFGSGAAMLSVLTITAIQREVSPALLSRTMAVVQLADMGLTPIGYAIAGPALALLGETTTLLISAVSVMACVGALCLQKDIRAFAHLG
jgi:MFS family permease